MVEAAMVLPLLVLSILTCLLVCMFFYETTISQCQLHEAVRCEAGGFTGHINYIDPPYLGDYELTTSRTGLFHTVSGNKRTAMMGRGLLRAGASANSESLWHAADGVTYVRYCSLVKQNSDQQ